MSPARAIDLSPGQPDRPRGRRNEQALAAIPASFRFVREEVFTVAIAPGGPPIATYATDASTVVGADPDIASLIADALGRRLELVPVAWADWPLGLVSGRFDAAISNIGVTEQRKEKFDFSTYRQGLHGFFVRSDSPITAIREPKDVAGLRLALGAGTNQERILLQWSRQNVANGLKPTEFLYFDDDTARNLALLSGRIDVNIGPNPNLTYQAVKDGRSRSVGTVSAGWPERSDVAITTRKGSGLAEALTIAVNGLMEDGSYAKVLARWGLEAEALDRSQTNPPGLPRF
ncbi:ABC transporter substrate-binding protein (plasmid) [Roseomonas gilardii subsp. gilardii]|nr:ABC transporter substrate-binding protein [Roseomonas gilardii]UPG74807.1 ABC transporter substrate-binding protein [Roseomonas gilardii subsp. gilardii]